MTRLLLVFFLWSWLQGMSSPYDLDPNGINVCKSGSITQELVCCPGWKQEGRACTAAICEGVDACKTDEVCIRPGVCRCKPGFFGASCTSPCPNQYWGSDCKQSCSCHPHGKCDPVTGQCTCNANRWGPNCQYSCHCSPQGRCNPLTGSCQCEPGWWAPYCNKQCHCNPQSSRCNTATGQCICDNGWWGQRCGMKCNCNKSPCLQITGKCKCQEGWWGVMCENQCDCVHGRCNPVSGECDCNVGYQGRNCADLCIAGTYGPQCKKRCGRCKQGQPCSPVDGFCLACDSGWNGTLCDQPCPPGYYGDKCAQICPKCRAEEVCNGETGTCLNCDAGKMGLRCESTCPAGTYGDKCQVTCPVCIHGSCDPVTGECICDAGYWQYSCNETCPHGYFGPNCSSSCECSGGLCSPFDGTCQWTSSQRGAIIAGVLVPLFLLFLLCCCCCCCGNNESQSKDRSSNGEEGSLSRMKHNFQGALANISSLLPCCSLGSSKLSWVTVSHHDAELPFNHSFIESPSTGWLSENSFSSFESDEAGPVYCVPPREGISIADMDAIQEMSSKCNVFPESLAFNAEDVSLPFSIPRTSSIAKTKRPSVSFAEGTKFESRRSSTTDTPNLVRKPKLALSLVKLASIQSQVTNGEGLQPCEQTLEFYEKVCVNTDPEEHPKLQRNAPVGRRRTMSNAQKMALKAEMVEPGLKDNINEMKKKTANISTVYVSVGHPRKPYKPRRKSDGNVDGAVQAVLKRLGSFQKGIPKPVRKNWAQTPNSKSSHSKISAEEDLKNKNTDSSIVASSVKHPDNSTNKPVIPATLILRKIASTADEGTDGVDCCDKLENTYSYLPDPGVLLETKETIEHVYHNTDVREDLEPKYENVSVTQSYVNNEMDTSGLYEDAEMNCE
ncbi:scavenger receptor class F member 1 [Discoglossus pictus]